eukprot:5441427-Alexandrium_andersonii.AAC.1
MSGVAVAAGAPGTSLLRRPGKRGLLCPGMAVTLNGCSLMRRLTGTRLLRPGPTFGFSGAGAL